MKHETQGQKKMIYDINDYRIVVERTKNVCLYNWKNPISVTLPNRDWFRKPRTKQESYVQLWFPDHETKLETISTKCPPLVLDHYQESELSRALKQDAQLGTDWEINSYRNEEREAGIWGYIEGGRVPAAWKSKKTGEVFHWNFAPTSAEDLLKEFQRDWERSFYYNKQNKKIPSNTQPNLGEFLEAWNIDWEILLKEQEDAKKAKEEQKRIEEVLIARAQQKNKIPLIDIEERRSPIANPFFSTSSKKVLPPIKRF